MAGHDDEFLYVDDQEMAEALSLGARRIEGEARMIMPRPLPDRVDARAFDRWRGQAARYRWCMRYVARILGEAEGVPDLDDLLQTLGTGHAAHERAYLWVPSFDMDRVRDIPGVEWDKRRRMYYATREADLGQLFDWMTPAARSVWESERVIQRALTLLVQDRARSEANPSGGADIDLGGSPKAKRPPSRTVPQ